MVRVSPDTADEGGAIDAYRYETGRMAGFSHTNLEGDRVARATATARSW